MGLPTEMGHYVGVSPRADASLMTQFTNRTSLGVMGDYTSYRTKRRETDGFQWRTLALVEWEVGRGGLSGRWQPFGQFGIGVGRIEYVGLTELEKLVGPASRLAAGVHVRVTSRISATTVLSFDRLDAAPNGMDRQYPTMVALSLSVAFHWPRGGPLITEPTESYLQD